MTTEVINETTTVIDAAEFAALADHVLTAMHVSPAAELNIMSVSYTHLTLPTKRIV